MIRDAVRISERGHIMSYHDVWMLTPLQRDIIVDELNEIHDQRYGKGAMRGAGSPTAFHPSITNKTDDTPQGSNDQNG